MKTSDSNLPFWQLWGDRPEERLARKELSTQGSRRPAMPVPLHADSAGDSFFQTLRAALLSLFVLTIVCCGLYPLVVYGIAQIAFPHQANGSLIVSRDGTVRGSELLGQNFTGAKYFHPRPSAAGNGYDAANSSGSNLGPTSQKLHDAIKERIAAYRAENGLKETDAVPADAVTASGSGLDPHISVRNAEIQADRVAKARGLSDEDVRQLVARHIGGRNIGVLGESGVNVLKLNLALDSFGSKP
jgi:potassium-transporting ATPase KdpC subunit